MDLLERARALAACAVFADLAPAVLVRLAARARVTELAAGERRSTGENVWVIAEGALAVASATEAVASSGTASSIRRRGGTARAGNVLGLVRVVAPATKAVEAIAEKPSVVVGLGIDDVRDVLEEDPMALSALCDALARTLLAETPDK